MNRLAGAAGYGRFDRVCCYRLAVRVVPVRTLCGGPRMAQPHLRESFTLIAAPLVVAKTHAGIVSCLRAWTARWHRRKRVG